VKTTLWHDAIWIAGAALGALALGSSHASAASPARDAHSQARPDRVRVTHADIVWTVDFESRSIAGSVRWTFQRAPGAETEPLILDTRGLAVESVRTTSGAPVRHEMGEAHAALGTPLRIHAAPGQTQVEVAYRTGPDASGLQWLTPSQTAGGRRPFLFSQAQAILARTFLPCQDSPEVRFTYTAQVRTAAGLTAVMAARALPGGGDGGPFRFEMPQPIPSYLVAVAVGEIAFRPLGPRTGVWAEPPVLEAAAREFADTEAMVAAIEGIYGPYRWERYDLIVLPPSFPFGGMENPRLTFATPTVLAGDRSLVALVAHELAHSWSGNLVTNATWSDFWLNEGTTVYLERRALEVLYGRERAEMEAVLGRQDLDEEMPALEKGYTVLHNTAIEGRDPDDAFSNVPYEKGALVLTLLERTVGRDRFDAFLRRWFDANAFRSRTTRDFETAVRDDLLGGDVRRAEALRLAEWLYEPGLPANAPAFTSAALARAEEEAAAFTAGKRAARELPGKAWTTHEWLRFLRALPKDLAAGRMAELDAAWSLTASGNSEIAMQWLLQAIRSRYEAAYPALERFLTSQGRRKLLKPLYTELAKTPDGKARAAAIYEKARPMYHAVSRNTIEEILGRGPA
jgi:aminopeptidase N